MGVRWNEGGRFLGGRIQEFSLDDIKIIYLSRDVKLAAEYSDLKLKREVVAGI